MAYLQERGDVGLLIKLIEEALRVRVVLQEVLVCLNPRQLVHSDPPMAHKINAYKVGEDLGDYGVLLGLDLFQRGHHILVDGHELGQVDENRVNLFF